MKSRLEVLLHQREVLREHTQWLEAEIAAERARSPSPPDSPPGPAPAPVVDGAADSASPAFAEPDVAGLHNEVRQGCLLYFFIATALIAAFVGIMYWKV